MRYPFTIVFLLVLCLVPLLQIVKAADTLEDDPYIQSARTNVSIE